jgi:hypothetical protein
MDKSFNRENISKIYCEKCDEVFDSKQKYDKHSSIHSTQVYESCPIDTVLGKIIGFFKRGK